MSIQETPPVGPEPTGRPEKAVLESSIAKQDASEGGLLGNALDRHLKFIWIISDTWGNAHFNKHRNALDT